MRENRLVRSHISIKVRYNQSAKQTKLYLNSFKRTITGRETEIKFTMGFSMLLWILAITVITLIYLNLPPPQFSEKLKNWHNKGRYYSYKDSSIFYIVEDGFLTEEKTLLCIHGFPTSSLDWSKVLADLKDHFNKIILLDMLGFGFSDKPKSHDYLITEQADILEAILESLSLTGVHILSHDYGDTVALELVHRYNHNESRIKVKSLCMLNGGIFPETNFPMLSQKLLLVPVAGNLLSHFIFYGLFKQSLGKTFGEHTWPTDDEMRDFYALVRHKDGNTNNGRIIQYIAQRNDNKNRWVGALQTTTIPVHMIYGPSDPVNPPVFINHYKRTVPQHSLHVLDMAIGHYPQWEDPKNVIKSYVNFLNKIKIQ